MPFAIEVQHYPEYTGEQLAKHGAAINYTAELIHFPPYKGWQVGSMAKCVRGASRG